MYCDFISNLWLVWVELWGGLRFFVLSSVGFSGGPRRRSSGPSGLSTGDF